MGASGQGPSRAEAEAIAGEALSFIAGEPRLARSFLNETGLDVDSLRGAAGDPSFLSGVLDFLMAHEDALIAFAGQAERRPEAVVGAAHRLAGIHHG